jgi:hypothetical protein
MDATRVVFRRVYSSKSLQEAHTYNPSTWEAEAGGSQVQGHPGV